MTSFPTTETAPQAQRTLPAPRVGSTAAWLVIGVLALMGCWAVVDLRINAATFIDGGRNAVDFAGRMLPLDFPPALELLRLSGQTLAIVVSATVLSATLPSATGASARLPAAG